MIFKPTLDSLDLTEHFIAEIYIKNGDTVTGGRSCLETAGNLRRRIGACTQSQVAVFHCRWACSSLCGHCLKLSVVSCKTSLDPGRQDSAPF